MIVLDLSCEHEHRFEGWFANADAFNDQNARGLVACPSCGSTRIERRPSAPYLNTATTRGDRATAPASPSAPPAIDPDRIAAALRLAARQAEDVGKAFPAEARRIHYGEAETRAIRGQAGSEEISELLDEGILVLPVPEEPPIQ